MNFRIVFRILGLLLLLLAGTMLLPISLAAYYGEGSYDAFCYSALLTGVIGFKLSLSRPKPGAKFGFKESILVVTFGWILFSIFGGLPYLYSGLNLSGSTFETMSGLSTTGATVFTDIEALDHATLFWRSLTQWIGGMGIVVLSLAIMPLLGPSGANLYKAEVPGPTTDKLMPKLQATAKLLWYVYLGITLLQVAAYLAVDMELFDAICHSMTTVASGGFSTKNASMAAYNTPSIQWITTGFMFAAGANFALHYRMATGKLFVYWKDLEFKTYFFLVALFSSIIAALLLSSSHSDIETAYRDATFQVVSIITTTGFVSANYTQWPPLAQFFILLLMFVGGCGGSTSGGVKVIRIIVLFRNAFIELRKVLHPSGIFHMKLGKTPLKEDVLSKILSFFFLYLVTILAVGAILTGLGHDLGTSLSAAVSCVGNIGPTFAGVGPVDNFSVISDPGKWVLTFGMLAGRLELFTILVLFTKEFWKN